VDGNIIMKIRNRFNELRLADGGKTITQLASLIGIKRPRLNHIKNNPHYNISRTDAEKICEYFNVTPGELLVIENGDKQSLANNVHTNPSANNASVEKNTSIKVNNLESIVEYVKRLPPKERNAVEGIYSRVLETVIMAMEK